MKKTLRILLTIGLMITNPLFGQGCESILMNGVFNTFSYSSGSYSSTEWHNFWCNGIVEQTGSSSASGASLNIAVAKIPLGLAFDDAREFQRIYKSIYCGGNEGSAVNISTNDVIQKVASPEILSAYVKCKEIENGGLRVNLTVRPDDRKVFVVDLTYTKAWGTNEGPKVKKVAFVPNVILTREGTLQDSISLRTGITYSMICERSTDVPVTVYIETEVGTFSANLPSFIPPPTDQQRIMRAMPRGTIIGWFDSRIPEGWVICDGRNGSPDLAERFPLGTKEVNSIGSQTGEKEHSHTFSGKTTYETKYRNLRDGNGLQGEGSQCMFHDHRFSGATEKSSNVPPATRILFIMKI